MGNFFQELRRRNVVRVTGLYAVVGWVLVQIATTLEESMGLPAWFDGLIVALLLIGLPIALIFAWAFELTPEGVVRTEHVPESESITSDTGRKLDYVIIAGIVVLGALILWQGSDKPNGDTDVTETAPATDPQADEPAAVSLAPLEKSIAVLPFENRSPNPDDAFFADGMHDDLLTHLSKIADMHVISRTSVMGYADTEQKIPDIARELSVATVMEGAVQRAGNRVRINVQLIDAETDVHLWAEIYDRELTAENIFDIQSEITRAIASALNAVLSSADEQELAKRPTQNLAAYDAYISGRLLSGRFWEGAERYKQAIAAFDKAIELDPEFGEAHAAKAYAQIGIYWYAALGGPWREAAKNSLQRAQVLAPDAVETLNVQGYYHYWGFLDYDRADIAFTRALEKSPNYVDALAGKAFVARRDSRYDEATALLEKADRLDPLNISVMSNLAETHAHLGRFDEAKAAVRRARAVDSTHHLDPATAGQVWEIQGDAARAWAAITEPTQLISTPNFSFRVHHAVATRDPVNIRDALESWPEDLRRPDDSPEAYELAKAKALLFLGETEAAYKLLAEIKERIEAAPVPYPQGWKANALYHPVELPGLIGDLDGVRKAIADFDANTRPDAWAAPNVYQSFARAFIRGRDFDSAFDYVDRMVAVRGPYIYPRLSVDVAFDPVREHPRYLALKADYEAWAEETGQ